MVDLGNSLSYAVERPRLLLTLEGALELPLTVITAQAGSGKTVLLSQWHQRHPRDNFFWLDVIAADNDPAHLMRRMLTALPRQEAGDSLPALAAENDGGWGEAFLTAFAAQLGQLPDTVVIFDDLHHLSNTRLIADLGRLVERLPANVHFVFSSRADLPIGSSRHRLRLAMLEIRQADLALDNRESALLLERVTGRALDESDVASLVSHTEGWAAGIQLAGLSLRFHPHPSEFIDQLTGTDRLIAEYLTDEVLQDQTAERRATLLRMSVLDTMCDGLVSAVAGEPEGHLIVEQLEHESLFLVPLDNRREWFRFHPLFRDLLRYRLRVEDPAAEEQLLDHAARWHLTRNEATAAAAYFARARNWDAVIDLTFTHGLDPVMRGDLATVIHWIDQVPIVVRSRHPNLEILRGVLLGMSGQFGTAEDVLTRLANDPALSTGQRMIVYAYLASRVQFRPDVQVSIAWGERSLHLLDNHPDTVPPDLLRLTDRDLLLTTTLLSLGRSYLLAGDFAGARHCLNRALGIPGSTFSAHRVHTLGSLALLDALTGRLDAADDRAHEAIALSDEIGARSRPATADAYLASAFSSLQRGELARAVPALREARQLASANRRTQLMWLEHVGTAWLNADQGRTAVLDEPPDTPPPLVHDRLVALESRRLRLAGFPEKALAMLPSALGPTPSAIMFESAAAAIASDQLIQARLVIDTIAPDAENLRASLDQQILRAWLSEASGEREAAASQLASAVTFAETHGLIESFMQAGPAVLRQLAAYGNRLPDYRTSILRRASETDLELAGPDLAEPLTSRELEILSYLPSRFTNTELAEQCFISVNTIKTHMAHIYRKLDAPNRNAAIRKARAIGLL
ncbi:LuxR C-terminal-related transcriptional regulator [Salinibacterium sp. ZJ450]|uniref:LuxR C-terminal-related transcriptional regulator n=1 Tax=Salinibacterium sp. ZJ450 TaxID=2708338 RepID=UPI0014240CEA|nr:LuxR C-terminal-related transcriptional regulator [Salinibacterium sp. ZJ450]